jgi:hypothetical protein
MSKLVTAGVTALCACILCAVPFSVSFSPRGSVSLSLDRAAAVIGRPLTPFSIAGVHRRAARRAYWSGAYGYGGAYGGYGAYGYGAYRPWRYGYGTYQPGYYGYGYGTYQPSYYGYGYGTYRHRYYGYGYGTYRHRLYGHYPYRRIY